MKLLKVLSAPLTALTKVNRLNVTSIMATARNFTGKVIIVTGSSSGIGEATAVYFATLGASIVVTGRNQKNLDKAAEKCLAASKASGARDAQILAIAADIVTEEGAKTLINGAVEKFGKIDVLVNNAGIGGVVKLENSNLMDTFDRVYSINVRAVVYLCHLARPHLEMSKGNIVNISSCAGLRPYVGGVAYCSSKSALDMIAKVLALELGPKGVRVNNVNPAIVKTPIFKAQGRSQEEIDEIYGSVSEGYPLGRPGEPVDIAKAIAFLASDDASWVSGLTMWVDGGSLDCSSTHTPKKFLEHMNT